LPYLWHSILEVDSYTAFAQEEGSKSVDITLGMLITGLVLLCISAILVFVQFLTSSTAGGATGGIAMYYIAGAFGITAGLLFLVGSIIFATAKDKEVVCYIFENTEGLRDPSCGFGAAFGLGIVSGVFALVYGILYFVLVKAADVAVVKAGAGGAHSASAAAAAV
jgi:hypothetical protein